MMSLALVLLMFLRAAQGYINDYDKPMMFKCPEKKVISNMGSVHNDYFEDRVWDIYCRGVPFTINCETSGYVNEFDKPASHTCSGRKVLTGIESYHEDYYEDRRWKFTCCAVSNRALTGCYWTDYLNEFDKPLSYNVPDGHAIRSIYSYHENYYEDRRFKLEVCKL